MPLRADVSLLFDLFVASQRVRRVLADGMAGAGMRADEYAVYSLLFEHSPLTATEMAHHLGLPLSTVLDYLKAIDDAGHLHRLRHPDDARAVQLALNARGVGRRSAPPLIGRRSKRSEIYDSAALGVELRQLGADLPQSPGNALVV